MTDPIMEQVAYWQRHGISPMEAWLALGNPPVWFVDWWEVRVRMRRWWRAQAGNEASPKQPAPAVLLKRAA